MAISVLAADVSFINFDNANKLAKFMIGETGADAMTHIEGGRIGAKPHHAMDLQRRHSLLAGQHQIDDLEPNPHRDIGVFEDRSDQDRKAISLRRTGWTFPFEGHRLQGINAITSAMWTMDTIWPATSNKVRFASIIRREQSIKLRDSHLFGEFRRAHGSDLRV